MTTLLFLLPYLLFAAGVPEPRWEAPDQPIHGPVKQAIILQTRYGHFETPVSVHVKWVYEYDKKGQLQRERYYQIIEEKEKLLYEKLFRNNAEIKRTGPLKKEFHVDEEEYTVIRIDNTEKLVFHYTENFEHLKKVDVFEKEESDYKPLFNDHYHYDEQGRLTKVIREQNGIVFPSKTVYYDGAEHKFDSPYFLEVPEIGKNGIQLHNSANVIGHREIEVFDQKGRRVYLWRRRVLTGSRKNPMTLEEAEKMVETIESRFDERGNELLQNNYIDGSKYIYFRSEHSDYDHYDNWLERTVFGSRDDGTEYLYSKSSRIIEYY